MPVLAPGTLEIEAFAAFLRAQFQGQPFTALGAFVLLGKHGPCLQRAHDAVFKPAA